MKNQIVRLREINDLMKQLTDEKKQLNDELLGVLRDAGGKKIQFKDMSIALIKTKRYNYSEQVEAIQEELKAEMEKEKEVAVSREEWEKMGKPHTVPIYDEAESLRMTIAKPKKLKA
jgi:hypothetical protein